MNTYERTVYDLFDEELRAVPKQTGDIPRSEAHKVARDLVDRGWLDEFQVWGEHPTGPRITHLLFRKGSGKRSFGFDLMDQYGFGGVA